MLIVVLDCIWSYTMLVFLELSQKVTAEIAMNVKRISEKIGNSETNADNLLNAMRTVQHSSQQIETLTNKVGVIERQIKDSGLGK